MTIRDRTIHDCVLLALNSMIDAQFSNGAWAQAYDQADNGDIAADTLAVVPDPIPTPASYTYPTGIVYKWLATINDEATVNCIRVMWQAHDEYGDQKYEDAADLGLQFLLDAQYADPQPAWSQQYSITTPMESSWARQWEPPSITGAESQDCALLLLDAYTRTGVEAYRTAAQNAIDYINASALDDGRIARFYEFTSNKPLYFTPEYVMTYDDSDLLPTYAFKITNRVSHL